MKELLCQNWTLIEVSDMLLNDNVQITNETSKRILARWLFELHHLRNARDDIRVALANSEKAVKREFGDL